MKQRRMKFERNSNERTKFEEDFVADFFCFKIGQFSVPFVLFLSFRTLTVNKCFLIIVDEWIRTPDLLCW